MHGGSRGRGLGMGAVIAIGTIGGAAQLALDSEPTCTACPTDCIPPARRLAGGRTGSSCR
jgi:hypothetical protein